MLHEPCESMIDNGLNREQNKISPTIFNTDALYKTPRTSPCSGMKNQRQIKGHRERTGKHCVLQTEVPLSYPVFI